MFSNETKDYAKRITEVVVQDGDRLMKLQVPDNAWYFQSYRAHVAVVVVRPP